MDYVCYVLLSGFVDLFMNLCFSAMSLAIPWRTLCFKLKIYTLYLVARACFSSNERRQFSGCSAVGFKKLVRFSWMSCMNLVLFIIRRFLLVANRGGGLGTCTSRWHTM